MELQFHLPPITIKRLRIVFGLIFLLILNFSYSQEKFNFKICYNDSIPKYKSGTTKYYHEYNKSNNRVVLSFGVFFNNEKIKILNKGRNIIDTILKTHASSGECDVRIYLKSNKVNKLCIWFDDKRNISFDVNNDYGYLRIDKFMNDLSLTYNKYPVYNKKQCVCEEESYELCGDNPSCP